MKVERQTQEGVLSRFKEIWGDLYDYSNVRFERMDKHVEVICRIHGAFHITPNMHIHRTQGCPICSRMNTRKLLYGKAYNDCNELGSSMCYRVWNNLLRRTIAPKNTVGDCYSDATIADEWLTYSKFKEWFDENYIEGYHLDKDLFSNGQKIYSPETCCFLPRVLNNAISVGKVKNGGHLHGKHWEVRIQEYGKSIYIGCCENEEDALKMYVNAKANSIKRIALDFFSSGKISERIYNRLLWFAETFQQGKLFDDSDFEDNE